MRLLLAVLLSVVCGSATTPGLIAHTCKTAASVSSLTTSSIDTTGANFIIVAAGEAKTPPAGLTLSDSRSNSYTALTLYTDPNGTPTNTIQFRYATSPAVGATTFTLTIVGGGTTTISICVEAWSFIQTSSPVEASNGTELDSASTHNQVSPGVVTPTLPFSLIVGAAHISNNGGTAETYSVIDSLGCGTTPGGGPFFTLDDQVSNGSSIGMTIGHCQEQVSLIAENPTFQPTLNLPGSWVGAVLAALAPLPASPMPHVN